MTSIICISDLHGKLPEAPLPSCDVLIIAGDVCPNFRGDVLENCNGQLSWLNRTFRHWLEKQPAKYTIAVFGNHDHIGQHYPNWVDNLHLPWWVLTDRPTSLFGLNFYGTPWSPNFGKAWAFMGTDEHLAERHSHIPANTDVLISHCPPLGYGDLALNGVFKLVHVGSKSLTDKIREIKPALTVFGHIHSGSGIYRLDDNIVMNASLINESYEPEYTPKFASFSGKRLISFGEFQ